MSTVTLNFARKWRSKQFDQIIGQELPVRMLKNSLYLNHYFPVYLFAGQRGCGKTSTARIFAASINCEMLDSFQKNPKDSVLPCLTCGSCRAMATNQHPDFCEIDAASHTGVDMIRQVIDSSLLLPLLGRKKIYLIDEAHMLSKASFNALLKILEEPPRTVVFMLATTDAQKIIETVRSRCFQLFFKPVDQGTLVRHLTTISTQEEIAYDADGLALIAQESDGSVRDAINLLEQVRFANDMVNKDAVLRVLGHIDDEHLLLLLDAVFFQTPATLLAVMHSLGLERFSPLFIWTRLTTLLRDALWIKYGVTADSCDAVRRDRLQKMVARCSVATVHALLEHLYNHESIFLKTTAQHAMLEMVLLQMCVKNRGYKDGSGGASPVLRPSNALEALPVHAEQTEELDEDADVENDEEDDSEEEEDDGSQLWASFVADISTLHDPVLQSIMSQARFSSFDAATATVTVLFSKDFIFFKDWLEQSREQWMPLLKKFFPEGVQLNPLFTETAASAVRASAQAKVFPEKTVSTVSSEIPPIKKGLPVQSKVEATRFTKKPAHVGFLSTYGMPLDVADISAWPKTALIMRTFPGTPYARREEGQ